MPSIRSVKRSQKPQKPTGQLPAEPSIEKICLLLEKQFQKEERKQKYAPAKEVLALLGRGALISAAILAPKAAPLLMQFVEESPDYDAWKRYNISYLKRTLDRLEREKQIEIIYGKEDDVVKLTQRGKIKILKYSLETLKVDKPKQWDGKWRLALYDIPKTEHHMRDLLREALEAIGFYAIQKSVYIFPYPCYSQIEFIRSYYGAGNHLQYMLVDAIENDEAYRTYFDLS